MTQRVQKLTDGYPELDHYLKKNGIHSLLLVCGKSLQYLDICSYFENLEKRLGIRIIPFSDFQPNPQYESVVKGVRIFRENKCESILAVGGGSAMDVAKCVKLYANMNGNGEHGSFLKQTVVPNSVKLLAIPTTAGTGSEATQYAVIYYRGEKQSVSHESCIPETVLMDGRFLRTLPLYQKKSTMMDAFCHSLESYWSVNSTEDSKKYSRKAIGLILQYMDGYLRNEDLANEKMFVAAYLAGRAIRITQTTAGHAMCYKLTGLYGISHGHAAALCVKELWPWMIEHIEWCIDPRGGEYLEDMFCEMAQVMKCKTASDAADKFRDMISELELEIPRIQAEDVEILCKSVNQTRLKNQPVLLDEDSVAVLYHKILKREETR